MTTYILKTWVCSLILSETSILFSTGMMPHHLSKEDGQRSALLALPAMNAATNTTIRVRKSAETMPWKSLKEPALKDRRSVQRLRYHFQPAELLAGISFYLLS